MSDMSGQNTSMYLLLAVLSTYGNLETERSGVIQAPETQSNNNNFIYLLFHKKSSHHHKGEKTTYMLILILRGFEALNSQVFSSPLSSLFKILSIIDQLNEWV